MNRLTKAVTDVMLERVRQDAKWGGAEHDDHHCVAEWAQLITDYAGWARVMAGMNSPHKARRRLIQVAAMAVAAVEVMDRAEGTTPSDAPNPELAELAAFLVRVLPAEHWRRAEPLLRELGVHPAAGFGALDRAEWKPLGMHCPEDKCADCPAGGKGVNRG